MRSMAIFAWVLRAACFVSALVTLYFILLAYAFFGCVRVPEQDELRVVSASPVAREPDFITSQGIRVYANAVPVTREQVEELTECFLNICPLIVPEGVARLDALPECQAKILRALEGSRLEWVEDINGEGVSVNGERVGGARKDRDAYVAWVPGTLLSMTSLYHEWAHLALGAKDGKDEDIWNAVETVKEDCR